MTRDERQVHRWLRKWQRLCLLQAWRYDVIVSSDSHSDTGEEEEVYAEVIPDPSYLTLRVTIYPEFWTLPIEERERRLLHELIHGPVESLARLARRAVRRKQAISQDVSAAEESLVEWFTNVLWARR